MKLYVFSDIHGDKAALDHLDDVLSNEKESFQVVLCGDLMYHGPRNSLPTDYDPASVAEILNKYASVIHACRGNCDSEVDQMLLSFPMMDDYREFEWHDTLCIATHGHLDHVDTSSYRWIFTGHTHVPLCKIHKGTFMVNPGSISIPKGKYGVGTYAVIRDFKVELRSLDHELLETYEWGQFRLM
ncbi:phosphodiesterase [Halosquirtibacter xylanolyticus]|uniref:phosphodiesterase n=1 Tax=Halosquirtibacter xylanolyticus TaxID=3374599 RepID=UPI00374967D9|nr:phosphodiesterase [Prolixibacteraceae bacterium]